MKATDGPLKQTWDFLSIHILKTAANEIFICLMWWKYATKVNQWFIFIHVSLCIFFKSGEVITLVMTVIFLNEK